jgi:hypothetical protein
MADRSTPFLCEPPSRSAPKPYLLYSALCRNDWRIVGTCSPIPLPRTRRRILIARWFPDIREGSPGFFTEALDAVSKILHR